MIYRGFYGQTMAVKKVANTAVNGKLPLAVRNPKQYYGYDAKIQQDPKTLEGAVGWRGMPVSRAERIL